MAELEQLDPEAQAELRAYTDATRATPPQLERALVRTLARVGGEEPKRTWRGRRRRLPWVVAASLTTLVFAGAAMAGVRWWRASPPRQSQVIDGPEADEFERAASNTQSPATADGTAKPIPAPTQIERDPSSNEDDIRGQSTDEESTAQVVRAARPKPKSSPKRRPKTNRPAEDTRETKPAPVTSATDLAEESRLLARLRRALDAGQLDVALDWAEEHARRHPNGALSEERLILEAVAACRDGQVARGRASLAQLRQRHPDATVPAQVDATCTP